MTTPTNAGSGPTQRVVSSPISEAVRKSNLRGQWLLEQPGDPKAWKRNELEVFICGEEGFAAIARDLRGAKHSIDIICYGFDPAMELERIGAQWPRGMTFGDLLVQKAEEGVRVRVLCWYGPIGAAMPGASLGKQRLVQRRRDPADSTETYLPSARIRQQPSFEPKRARGEYNATWYEEVFAGSIKNLCFRTRRLRGAAADAGLAADDAALPRGWVENFGLEVTATHHQKTVLVDYDHLDGRQAKGFVMGLNSLTDYWDTAEHLFKDPRRGEGWEGDGGEPGLKPYQDYACRIRGEALADVAKNFCTAWNRTAATETGGEGPAAIYQKQSALAEGLGLLNAQIVRTQSEEDDQSIRRLYQQATKFARKYVYAENQYFQYTPWVAQLKAERESYRKSYKAGQGNYGKDNTPPPDIPWLHVFSVTPTPERELMVPRTYDTVKALGHGDSMPNQDKRIEEELRAHQTDTDRYHKQQYEYEEYLNTRTGPVRLPPSPIRTLTPLARNAQASGLNQNISKQLTGLGIRSLVASLWTFDPGSIARQKEAVKHLEDSEKRSTYNVEGKRVSGMQMSPKERNDALDKDT
ncbi:MAG: phospholipase, partial [Rhodoferax sp.]|nr:phospholipase [Rhodoferax sp.]